MLKKIRKAWQGMSPHDRKLVRWTAIVCYVIAMGTLAYLYNMAKHQENSQPTTAEGEHQPTGQGVDAKAEPEGEGGEHPTAHTEETGEELPPPPADAQELLAGLDDFDTKAHRELSRIYAERQDYGSSLQHARRIAPWMEEDLEFQGQIGKTLLLTGNPGEAIPYLDKAIKLGGPTPDLLADRALAIFRAKGPEEGTKAIQEALQEFPDDPLLSTHGAAMFGESKEHPEESEAQFRKLVHRFPNFAEARYQYGRFLMNQGNYASSLREIQAAIKLDPLDSRMHARLGMAYFHLGRDADAERAYKTALAMNPKDYNTWYNLGELHLSVANETEWAPVFAERTRLALEAYLAVLANKPDHHQAHFRVGVILNANRQYREALRHLEYALQSDPHSIRILVQIAAAWEALGEKQKAWDFVQQAYEIDPFDQLVLSQYRHLKMM